MTHKWLGCVVGCLLNVGLVSAQDAPSSLFTPRVGDEVGREDRLDSPAPSPGTAEAGSFWVRGEYLLWQIRSAPVPALVGTIPSKQAERIQLLDNSTLTSHFGGSGPGIDYRAQSGLRLEAGLWLDEDRQYGLEGSFFQLGQGRQQFQVASKGGEALGPIFFRDSLAGQELLIMEAVPGLRAGEMTIEATQHLWGAEANVFRRLAVGNFLDYLDLSVGFRHLQFSEGLRVQGTSQTILGGHLPCG